MTKLILFVIPLILILNNRTNAQSVILQIDAMADRKPISPYIYGVNNCLSDNPEEPLTNDDWQFLCDAGVRMFRENGGNNATKYNWRLKLSSHPDWYNNVYSHDWDYEAMSLQEEIPGAKGMWAFQLIGKAASNNNHNFNDWAFNGSDYWSGVTQNLAGGGTVNTGGGSDALVDGDPDLYLLDWPADSTTGILDHWFGQSGIGLRSSVFNYWSMDNEPEIWYGTHDDIMPVQLSAEQYMQKYFAVAKKAREAFPDVKLVGPVPANEWYWFAYGDGLTIDMGDTNFVWLRYFIKRVTEEQKSSGIRLLDVLDIHFYPYETEASDIVQLHRVFFDKTYDYPGANGVKMVEGGWNNSITKEYIFERCRQWLVKYLGENHGVEFSVSELGLEGNDPNVTAVCYASMLGTFAGENIAFFTPWGWKEGMWETLHLFSRYAKEIHIKSTSSKEEFLSAYSSLSNDYDSLTIFLVNRSLDQTYNATVNLSNFSAENGIFNTLTISNLPTSETFLSHNNNSLQPGSVIVTGNSFSINLSPLSITAVMLSENSLSYSERNIKITPDFYFNVTGATGGNISYTYKIPRTTDVQIQLFDLSGRLLTSCNKQKQQQGSYADNFNPSSLVEGIYLLKFMAEGYMDTIEVFLTW